VAPGIWDWDLKFIQPPPKEKKPTLAHLAVGKEGKQLFGSYLDMPKACYTDHNSVHFSTVDCYP